MKASSLILSLGCLTLVCGSLMAQRGRPFGPPPGGGPGGPRGAGGGPRPDQLGERPSDLGSAGIVWYPILKDGLAEAERTNKPIIFMAVASQCGGVSGVFWPGYTATQNREFSDEKVIEATRDFVCVRIDSYESEEAQTIVRSYLNGRFENTAFCILSPDGRERLSASHRGPHQVLGGDLVGALNGLAKKYQAKGGSAEAAVPDFPNFRLGLNVASADQRLLVLVSGTDVELKEARKTLPALSNDAEILGKFHYDFETDPSCWEEALKGETVTSGIMVVAPSVFGQEGRVVRHLPLKSTTADLKKTLLEANATFAKETPKKVYGDHVQAGRRQGVEWKMPMDYGEDRDGDGKIDFRGPPRRRN